MIPRGNKPISPDRDRERPTDDKPEVPRPSGRDQPWIGINGQLLKDIHRTLTRIGQRPAQRHRIGTAHVPLAHTVEVCARQSVRMSEHVFVGHRRTAYRRCIRRDENQCTDTTELWFLLLLACARVRPVQLPPAM